MYKPPIRGKFLKKAPTLASSGRDFAESVGGVAGLVYELKQLKQDIIDTIEYKIQEIDDKFQTEIDEVKASTKEEISLIRIKALNETKQEVQDYVKNLKEGPRGHDADPYRIAQYVLSQIPTPKEVNAEQLKYDILAEVPRVDEEQLARKILGKIPKNKPSLKVIQEKFEADPMSVIEKIMQLPEGKFKLSTKHIDGLEQTMSAFRSQLGRGYLHGGGDTVIAGSGITITTNSAGKKVITASGGSSLALEAPVGSGVTYTTNYSPLFMSVNGQAMINGDGYTQAGLTEVFDVAPGSSLHSFYGSGATEDVTGTYNGTNKIFTVAHVPLFMFVEGQVLVNGSGYTAAGLTITFDNAPVSSATTHSFYSSLISLKVPTGDVNNVNTSFGVSSEPVFVIVNGQILVAGDGYVYSSSTINLTFPVGTGGSIYSIHN